MILTRIAEHAKANYRTEVFSFVVAILLNLASFKIPPMCYSSPAPAPQRYSISRDLNS